MVRKALFLLPVIAGALVASQWQDISRYIKLRQMSSGGGHPENVPVEGSHAYPTSPNGGAADGTGDFDSLSRGGGPASS